MQKPYVFAWLRLIIMTYIAIPSIYTANEGVTNTSTANSTTPFTNDTSPSYTLPVTSPLNRISVPAGAFQNATNPETGVFFSIYATSILFPLRLNQSENDTSFRTIGSSVISATVAGLNISGLNTEPVKITLAVTVTVSLTGFWYAALRRCNDFVKFLSWCSKAVCHHSYTCDNPTG